MSVESERAQSAGSDDGEEARGDVDDGNGERDVSYRGCEKPRGLIFDEGDDVVDSRGFRGEARRVVNPGASDAGAGLASRLNRKRRVARLTRSALHARLRAESARKALSLAKTRTARTPANGPTRPREKRPTARSASAPALAPEPTARTARWARVAVVARRGLDERRRGLDRGRDRVCTLLGSALGRESGFRRDEGAPPSLPRRT